MNETRFRKNDLIFLIVIIIIIALLFVVRAFSLKNKGGMIKITLDNRTYGEYSLNKDRTIKIKKDGNIVNIVKIKNDKACMVYADCPDKLCIKMGRIDKVGESIVCLPNRVVVTVISGKDNSLDSVAE